MRAVCFAIAGLALGASVPAAAASFILTAFGQVVAGTSPNPVAGLPFGTGSSFAGAWRIDFPSASRTPQPPAGGTGTVDIWDGAVRNGTMAIFGPGGTIQLTQTSASRGAVLVVDNGTVLRPTPPNLRFDQIGLLDGAGFRPGLALGYAVSGALPTGTFLSSFNLGRNFAVPDPGVPSLVQAGVTPDFAAIISGGPVFLALRFAQGNPATPAELAALPSSSFSVISPIITVTAVPEPASWALLIGGFGLVGLTVRARRAATSRTAA